MINIISSQASAPNTLLQEVPRRDNEDNLRWLSRHPRPGEDQTGIVLVGGTSTTSFRLRVAQSHVRHDLMPSYWSHAMLLGQPAGPLPPPRCTKFPWSPRRGSRFRRLRMAYNKGESANTGTRTLSQYRPTNTPVAACPGHGGARSLSETARGPRWCGTDRALAHVRMGRSARRQSAA